METLYISCVHRICNCWPLLTSQRLSLAIDGERSSEFSCAMALWQWQCGKVCAPWIVCTLHPDCLKDGVCLAAADFLSCFVWTLTPWMSTRNQENLHAPGKQRLILLKPLLVTVMVWFESHSDHSETLTWRAWNLPPSLHYTDQIPGFW